jgi:hypothetical protein
MKFVLIFFQASKSYLKRNSSLSLPRERRRSLPTKARLAAGRDAVVGDGPEEFAEGEIDEGSEQGG